MKFFRCKHCGKIIAMVDERQVPTMCCGEAMEELIPNTQDGAHEKHIPVIELEGNIAHVKVGEVEHPMLDVHYIKWILLVTDKGSYLRKLRPNQAPATKFIIDDSEVVLEVLAYCNLHGLWKCVE